MNRRIIEAAFPSLLQAGYDITSPPEKDYNCIAWAAGDQSAWWEPDPQDICYWPAGTPRTYSLEAYIIAFEILGFERCENGEHEDGFEKVALYISSGGKPTHAARQLNDGSWTSKLGNSEDIQHGSLAGLEGTIYGSVSVFLKRAIFN